MRSRLALWIALRIVRAAGVLTPSSSRAEWMREWDAELRHRAARPHLNRSVWRTDMNLIVRALGAAPDAAWLRRQFTLDADAIHDAGHGLRLLMRTPGFTAIALLIFAVGIGATTAIVSLADALLVRPLPVADVDRVMTIWQDNRETAKMQEDVAPGNAIDILRRTRSFAPIAIVEPWSINATLPGREPEYLQAAMVTDRFFDVLGMRMAQGRAFLPQEHRRGAGRTVVLSHGFWRDRFDSDPSIAGKAVRLDTGAPYTVVGVMPRVELKFFDTRATRPEPAVWLPKRDFEAFEPNLRNAAYWNVIGRLAPGVSIEQARAELDALSAQLAREYPKTNRHITARIVPLREHLVGSLRHVLPLLLGAAAILLFVACANVANLLLARGVGRGREFAVRQALGASRGRLARQMLVESLLLATAGGIIGLALARWTLDVIARLRPLDVARIDYIPIDLRAAAIACGVTLVAAIVAGLTPALQLSRPAAVAALKETRTSGRRGVRSTLVVIEVAAALVLAVAAGLLARSFALIQNVDPGFSREQVAVLQVFVSPRLDTPQKRIVFFQQALDRLRALPGVVAAGGVTSMPFGDAKVRIRVPIEIDGRVLASGEELLTDASAVAGDYFETMGVSLLQGRWFEASDSAGPAAIPVPGAPTNAGTAAGTATGAGTVTPTPIRQAVLVSQAAARKYWPGVNPVGSRVRFRFSNVPYDGEVIGVVGDVLHEALDRPAPPEIFLPYDSSGFRALTLVVRTAPDSRATLQMMKQEIWALDPLQSIFHTATLDALISRSLTSRLFVLFLLGGFAIVTLVLAAAGVYGVTSFTTTQRTREFGVRLALGAARRDIIRLVLGDGIRLTILGILIGIVIALPLMRLLRTLLFGVSASDPITFLSIGAVLVLVAAAACYIPARRALDVDPVKALRVD